MSLRSFTVLALGLLAVGGALAWREFSASERVAPVAVSPGVSDGSATDAPPSDAVIEVPSSSATVDPNAAPASTPDTDPGHDGSSPSVPPEPWHVVDPRGLVPRDELYAARYAGYDLEGILAAGAIKLHRLQRAQRKAFDERYERGTYDVRGANHVEGGLPGYKLSLKPGGPLAELRGVPDDPTIAHVVWLPFEEYSEIYDMQEEWAWLAQKAYLLENPPLAVK